MKNVYDPEMLVNAVDLGPHTAQQAEWAIMEVEGAADIEFEMVFDHLGLRT